MSSPINNNLRNISPAGLSSNIDSGSTVGDNQNSAQNSTGATATGISQTLPTGAAPATLAGNSRLLPSSGQNIDWFSDLDAGSKLPITLSDRLQGKSIQEMSDIIMGHLGLRN
ncbi:MAG: hypothetical protein KTR32_33575 [Granulosicoccus sp.]|nr:hypothetical protein [Granulosicoccus sp.]